MKLVEGVRMLEKAVALAPTNRDAQMQLAIGLLSLREYERAVDSLIIALGSAPSIIPSWTILLRCTLALHPIEWNTPALLLNI